MEMARASALALPACPCAAPGAAKSRVRAPIGAWGGQVQVQVPGLALCASSGFVAKFPAVAAQVSDGVDAALLEVGDAEEARASNRKGILWFDLLEYESQHGPVSLIPRDDEQPESVVFPEDVTTGSVLEEPAFVEEESAGQTTSEVPLPHGGEEIVDLAEDSSVAEAAIDLASGIDEVQPSVLSSAGKDHDSLSTSSLAVEDGAASSGLADLAASGDRVPTDIEHAEDNALPLASLEEEEGVPTETGIAELDRVIEASAAEDVVLVEERKAVAVNPETSIGLIVQEEVIAVPDEVVGEPPLTEATSLEPPGDVASALSPADEEAEEKLGEPPGEAALSLEPLGGDDRGIISASLLDEDELSVGAEELKEPAAHTEDFPSADFVEGATGVVVLDDEVAVNPVEGTPSQLPVEELLESSAAVISADIVSSAQPGREPGEPSAKEEIISSSSTDDAAVVGQEEESAIQVGDDRGIISASLLDEDGLSVGAEELKELAALTKDFPSADFVEGATGVVVLDDEVAINPAEGTPSQLPVEELLESSAAIISADIVSAQPGREPGEPSAKEEIISSSSTDDAAVVGQEEESAIQVGDDRGIISASPLDEDGLSVGAEELKEPAALTKDFPSADFVEGATGVVVLDDEVAVNPAEGTPSQLPVEELLESSAAIISAEIVTAQPGREPGEPSAKEEIISSSSTDDAAVVGQEEESAIQELGPEGADKVLVAGGEGEGEEPIEPQNSVADSASILEVQVEQAQGLPAQASPLDVTGRHAEEASVAVPGGDELSQTQSADIRLNATNVETPTAEAEELEDKGVFGDVISEVPASEITSILGVEESSSSEEPNGEQEMAALEAVSVNHVRKEITGSLDVGPSAATVETEEKQEEAISGATVSDVSCPEAASDITKEAVPVTESQEEVGAELSPVAESARQGEVAVEPFSAKTAPVSTEPQVVAKLPQEAEGEAEEEAEESQGTVNPCKVYVAGLPFERTSKELRDELTELFGRYGSVKDLQVVPFRTKGGKELKGRHRGIAFVEMESDEEVKAAVEDLNAKPNFGRILMVRTAVIGKPPKEGFQSPPGYQLYVGNLDKTVTKEKLFDVFRAYGNVVSTKVIKDFNTGEPRGFGFVTYATEEEARQAAGALNGSQIAGSAIRVSMS